MVGLQGVGLLQPLTLVGTLRDLLDLALLALARAAFPGFVFLYLYLFRELIGVSINLCSEARATGSLAVAGTEAVEENADCESTDVLVEDFFVDEVVVAAALMQVWLICPGNAARQQLDSVV